MESLFWNTFRTFARQSLSIAVQLAITVILARALGPEGNGQYAIATLLPLLLVNLVNLGVPSANVYFVARKAVALTKAWITNIQLSVLLSLLGVAIGGIMINSFSNTFFSGVPYSLLWLGIAFFPLSLLSTLLTSLLQAKQDFSAYNITLILPSVINLLGVIALVWWLNLGPGAAVASWGIGQLFGALAAIACIMPYLRPRQPAAQQEDGCYFAGNYTYDCLCYGVKAYASNVIMFLNYRIDIFLVNMFLGSAPVGIYVVAVQIAEKLWLLSQAVSTVLLPRLSELEGQEDVRRQLTPLVARWVTYCGVIFALLMAIVVKSTVNLVFGTEYSGAAVALLYLLPGIVTFNCARVLANDLAARGRPDLNIWTSAITLVTNVVANLLFIPRYGVLGAAIATTLAYGVTTGATLVFYARVSNNPWWLPLVPKGEDRRILGHFAALIKNTAAKVN